MFGSKAILAIMLVLISAVTLARMTAAPRSLPATDLAEVLEFLEEVIDAVGD